MTRFIHIPEHEDFFKSLKLTLNNYAISIGSSTNQHFADVLHIKGDNKSSAFSNLINAGTGKDLKCREWLTLLDNCPEYQKANLDYICNRYGFICSESSKTQSNENFEELFLKIADINGDLAKEYLQAKEDGVIDKQEQKNIDDLMYQFRALIKSYEFGKAH